MFCMTLKFSFVVATLDFTQFATQHNTILDVAERRGFTATDLRPLRYLKSIIFNVRTNRDNNTTVTRLFGVRSTLLLPSIHSKSPTTHIRKGYCYNII